MTVDQNTHYPFDEEVEFVVDLPKEVRFALYLRVPGWCDGARVAINGKRLEVTAKPRCYIRIDRTWSRGDRVNLTPWGHRTIEGEETEKAS